MRLLAPQCPHCGAGARGTVEQLTAVSRFRDVATPDGFVEWSGSTETFTETQSTVQNETGESLVTCGTHEWYTKILET